MAWRYTDTDITGIVGGWGGGNGTEASPYLIYSVNSLTKLSYDVNTGTTYAGVYFKLIANINLSGYSWVPIGGHYGSGSAYFDSTFGWQSTADRYFAGSFDGNGYTISGLTYDVVDASYGSYVGLFGRVTGTVKNTTISSGNVSTFKWAGGIVGELEAGAITNCTNSAAITAVGAETDTNPYAGGIAGLAFSGATIERCTNYGVITTSYKYAGGIVGACWSTPESLIAQCTNYGNVSCSEMCGGIAGTLRDGCIIERCVNTGEVSGYIWTGGISGLVHTGSYVLDCSNSGYVHGGHYDIGGIVGNLDTLSIVDGCVNSGEVYSSYTVAGEYQGVGGIVGSGYGSATIRNCSNSGYIHMTTSYGAGGIAGVASPLTIRNCYNTGTITAGSYVGGIVGRTYNSASYITNCYNSGSITRYSGTSSYFGAIIGYCRYCTCTYTYWLSGSCSLNNNGYGYLTTGGTFSSSYNKYFTQSGTTCTLSASPGLTTAADEGMGKVLVGGTGYTITAGNVLVDGTGYAVFEGRQLVDGTEYITALPDISSSSSTDLVLNLNNWVSNNRTSAYEYKYWREAEDTDENGGYPVQIAA